MFTGNKDTRHKAIPFQSFPFELEPHAPPGASSDQLLLLQDPTLTTDAVKTVKMTRPENGDLIEMYLFMEMTAPSTSGISIRIGIQDVDQDHVLLTGTGSAFSVAANGTLTIEANLISRIPKFGETNFSSDYFTLLVEFGDFYNPTDGYALNKFACFGSAQMALT